MKPLRTATPPWWRFCCHATQTQTCPPSLACYPSTQPRRRNTNSRTCSCVYSSGSLPFWGYNPKHKSKALQLKRSRERLGKMSHALGLGLPISEAIFTHRRQKSLHGYKFIKIRQPIQYPIMKQIIMQNHRCHCKPCQKYVINPTNLYFTGWEPLLLIIISDLGCTKLLSNNFS